MALSGTEAQTIEEAKTVSLENAQPLQKLNRMLEQFIEILPDHVNTEGIFRISASQKEINNKFPSYLENPNKIHLKDIDDASMDIHIKSGIIKKALTEVKPNLAGLSDEAKEVFENFKKEANIGNQSQDNNFRILIEGLIKNNALEEARFFYQLMHIAQQISANKNTNKMTAENMGTALLSPKIQEMFDTKPDPSSIIKQINNINSMIKNELQSEEGNDYFSKPFNERFPKYALSSAQDVIKRSKSKPETKPTMLDESSAPTLDDPSVPSVAAVDKQLTLPQKVTSVIQTVANYIKQFDFKDAFNKLFKFGQNLFGGSKKKKESSLNSGDNSSLKPTENTNISDQTQENKKGDKESMETIFTVPSNTASPTSTLSDSNPSVMSASNLNDASESKKSEKTATLNQNNISETFEVTRETALSQLKEVDKELKEIKSTVRKLNAMQAVEAQAKKKVDEIDKKIDIIHKELPAKEKHRVIAMRADLGELKTIFSSKRSEAICPLKENEFKERQSFWKSMESKSKEFPTEQQQKVSKQTIKKP